MIVFAICSSINGHNKGCYNLQERFEQTIKTINSIKNINTDNIYLILCDNSNLPTEYKEVLIESVDLFISSNSSNIDKSVSESRQMIEIIDNIKDLEYDILFKISGRYYLKDDFDISKYNNDKINFREFNHYGKVCYSTVFYSFSKKYEQFMRENYDRFINENKSIDIETGLYNMINNVVNKIEYLGVAGNIAPSGEYIEH